MSNLYFATFLAPQDGRKERRHRRQGKGENETRGEICAGEVEVGDGSSGSGEEELGGGAEEELGGGGDRSGDARSRG